MGLESRIDVNHASFIHFSKVLEVFGGLPLPGKENQQHLSCYQEGKEPFFFLELHKINHCHEFGHLNPMHVQ